MSPLRVVRGAAALGLALVLGTVARADEADDHLLAGATAYRDGRLDEALVEFNVALKLGGSREARWYVAVTLAKQQKLVAALEAFALAGAEAPQLADAVLEYHWATTCYQLHLLACADEHLERADRQAGPQLKKQVAAVREAIALVLAETPPTGAIDAVLESARQAQQQQRPALARAFFREAAALAHRRTDAHGLAEAERVLSTNPVSKGDP